MRDSVISASLIQAASLLATGAHPALATAHLAAALHLELNMLQCAKLLDPLRPVRLQRPIRIPRRLRLPSASAQLLSPQPWSLANPRPSLTSSFQASFSLPKHVTWQVTSAAQPQSLLLWCLAGAALRLLLHCRRLVCFPLPSTKVTPKLTTLCRGLEQRLQAAHLPLVLDPALCPADTQAGSSALTPSKKKRPGS